MCALYRFRKVGRGCLFATLYISSFSSVLSRFNCVMDKLHYSPSETPVRSFICLLLDGVVHPLRLAWWSNKRNCDYGCCDLSAILCPTSWSRCCRPFPSMVATDPIMDWLGSGRCLLSKSNHAFWWLGMLSRCNCGYACSLPCDVRNCGHGH